MMSEKEKELKGLGEIWVDPNYFVDRLQISRPIEIQSHILFFCASLTHSYIFLHFLSEFETENARNFSFFLDSRQLFNLGFA